MNMRRSRSKLQRTTTEQRPVALCQGGPHGPQTTRFSRRTTPRAEPRPTEAKARFWATLTGPYHSAASASSKPDVCVMRESERLVAPPAVRLLALAWVALAFVAF